MLDPEEIKSLSKPIEATFTGEMSREAFDYMKSLMAPKNIKRVPTSFRVNRVGVETLKEVFASPHFPAPAGIPYAIHGMRVKLDPFVPDWVCETLDQRGKLLEVTHLYAGCSVKVGGEYLS